MVPDKCAGFIDSARAFNEGSDARLAGFPLRGNPYLYDCQGWRYWRMGWNDVDRHWCENTRAYRTPLPPVIDVDAMLDDVASVSSDLDRWIRGGEEE